MVWFSNKKSYLTEDKRKGVIFNYFMGTAWFLMVAVTIQNLYLASVLEGDLAQKYADFNSSNIGFLLFLGLVWWGHRWYPQLMRHTFLLVLVVGAIFLFKLEDLDRIFVVLSLPMVMAAFLIQPVYSFVYLALIAGAYTLRLYLAGDFIVHEEFPFVGLISLSVFAMAAWLISRSLDRALAETQALNRELDQRVQDRTRELAEALERERTTAIRNTTILESIADGVMVFDATQKVMVANPAANQLANVNLLALNVNEILAGVEEKTRETIQNWIRGEKPADQSNIKFDWHKRTVSATVAPVVLPTADKKKVDAGSVMVLRDFSQEAQLERAKDLFLGTVSHELRTPMSAIQGYVDILLETEKDAISEMGYEHLQTIQVSIRQLLKLANELIDLSRLETGEIDLYCQWVDIEAVIYQTVKIVQQEFKARDLYLKVKANKNLPQLYVDRNRIMQVLLNLLSNAYKYTSKGGASVEVNHTEDTITIAVADTGVGISETDQASMFSRFFRAGDQIVQKAGGTGLGLSISKGLAELHGGALEFESQYGVGTTFRVKLPINGATIQNEK